MTVHEKIKELFLLIHKIEEKYCENCQTYDCYMCPYLFISRREDD